MAAPYVTFGDIRQAVRDNLDEIDDVADSGYWSNARLGRIINRAIHHVWAEVRKLKLGHFIAQRNSSDGIVTILGASYDCAGFGIAAADARYTLPPDFVEMVELRGGLTDGRDVAFQYLAQTDPRFQSLRLQGADATSAATFYYTITGPRDLLVVPVPEQAVVTHIEYVRVLPTFAVDGTDDDEDVEVPHPLHIAVEEIATWRAQLQDRDASAGAWSQVAQASVARFLGSAGRSMTDTEHVPSVFD